MTGTPAMSTSHRHLYTESSDEEGAEEEHRCPYCGTVTRTFRLLHTHCLVAHREEYVDDELRFPHAVERRKRSLRAVTYWLWMRQTPSNESEIEQGIPEFQVEQTLESAGLELDHEGTLEEGEIAGNKSCYLEELSVEDEPPKVCGLPTNSAPPPGFLNLSEPIESSSASLTEDEQQRQSFVAEDQLEVIDEYIAIGETSKNDVRQDEDVGKEERKTAKKTRKEESGKGQTSGKVEKEKQFVPFHVKVQLPRLSLTALETRLQQKPRQEDLRQKLCQRRLRTSTRPYERRSCVRRTSSSSFRFLVGNAICFTERDQTKLLRCLHGKASKAYRQAEGVQPQKVTPDSLEMPRFSGREQQGIWGGGRDVIPGKGVSHRNESMEGLQQKTNQWREARQYDERMGIFNRKVQDEAKIMIKANLHVATSGTVFGDSPTSEGELRRQLEEDVEEANTPPPAGPLSSRRNYFLQCVKSRFRAVSPPAGKVSPPRTYKLSAGMGGQSAVLVTMIDLELDERGRVMNNRRRAYLEDKRRQLVGEPTRRRSSSPPTSNTTRSRSSTRTSAYSPPPTRRAKSRPRRSRTRSRSRSRGCRTARRSRSPDRRERRKCSRSRRSSLGRRSSEEKSVGRRGSSDSSTNQQQQEETSSNASSKDDNVRAPPHAVGAQSFVATASFGSAAATTPLNPPASTAPFAAGGALANLLPTQQQMFAQHKFDQRQLPSYANYYGQQQQQQYSQQQQQYYHHQYQYQQMYQQQQPPYQYPQQPPSYQYHQQAPADHSAQWAGYYGRLG